MGILHSFSSLPKCNLLQMCQSVALVNFSVFILSCSTVLSCYFAFGWIQWPIGQCWNCLKLYDLAPLIILHNYYNHYLSTGPSCSKGGLYIHFRIRQNFKFQLALLGILKCFEIGISNWKIRWRWQASMFVASWLLFSE